MRKVLKNKELRKRVLFTLAMLFVYVIGINITVPGVNKNVLQSALAGNSLFSILNTVTGGSFQSLSLFSLGVGPYITASIVIQLLSMDVVPYLTELAKGGNKERLKIDQITRYLGLILAIVQGFSMTMLFDRSYGVLEESTVSRYMFTATMLTAGTMFLLWIADKITEKGIGNGVSIIIFTGIVINLPSQIIELFQSLVIGGTAKTISEFVIFILMYVLIIVCAVIMELAERRIKIQSPSASMSSQSNYLPLKINSASVIPVIFAQSLISAPQIILSFISAEWYTKVSDFLSFEKPHTLIIYSLLIVIFSFFYSNLVIDPEKASKNLKNGGFYIPGIRPGKETQKYITTVLNRITVMGAIGLTVLALMPYVIPMFTDLPSTVSVGGTGVIIVVGVALETIKQLETESQSKDYLYKSLIK